MKDDVNEKTRSDETNYNCLQGRILANAAPGEEIVISGLAGTYPHSTDVYHLQENLFNKVDMVLPTKRWDYVHPEIPVRCGNIPNCTKYDSGFFGVHNSQADAQDTMGRILLEKVVEAIFDAGLNLSDMEDTNTGVYLGICFSEMEASVFRDNIGIRPKLAFTGCIKNSVAQRISYFLKLKGRSFTVDTACSSSMYALENAFRDLRLGLIDMAIVGGANMCFHPFVSMQFARLGVLSLDGTCKVFDQSANGYAKSEAIGAILLQKSKVAKRKYSELIYIKTNCDGFKEAGITFPSAEAQTQLLIEAYKDSGIDPAALSYLEAHGTGTVVGDPEECNGIDEVLAKPRKEPLLIGSVKSNIGHSEPSSAISSLTKCIIAMESGYIPPNIHFTTPRESIAGLVEGRMKVITEKTPFQDNRGILGVNSFGFGGGNGHALLRSNKKEKVNKGIPKDDIPRIVCVSGRNDNSITVLLDEVRDNGLDAEYIGLLHNVFRKNINGHVYRGYSILSKTGEICRFSEICNKSKRTPLYFVFGELNDWFDIGKDFMNLPIFSATIDKAQKLLLSKGINVRDTIFGHSKRQSKFHVIGSILVQIAITDVFKSLEIQPIEYLGYSVGEIVAAYFNEMLSFKQTVDCAIAFNDIIEKLNEDSVQSGKTDRSFWNDNESSNKTHLSNLCSRLKSSEFSANKMEIITNLSSILDSPNSTNGGKFQSAEYILNALTGNSSSKFKNVESDSIVFNFGSLLASEKIPKDINLISLESSGKSNSLVGVLKILGNLYVNGYNPLVAKLYPEVKFPVSRGTRMISPFIIWNHSRDWFTPSFDMQAINSARLGSNNVKIQINDQQWSFVEGHCIDGRNLFPAIGYLFLAWETLAMIEEVPQFYHDVVFQDCRFLRATTIRKKGYVSFFITVNRFSHKFEIAEGDAIVATGKVFFVPTNKEEDPEPRHVVHENTSVPSRDVYKELRLRGYNYSGSFKGIKKCNDTASFGYIKWEDNWISFIDSMLHLKTLQTDSRLLFIPIMISELIIKATNQLEWIKSEYLDKNIEPLLPVTSNETTGEIRCKNIVIKDLMATSIPRKKDLRIPVLESYQFIPNITHLELNESIRVNVQIFLENSPTHKIKVIELIDDFTSTDVLLLPLVQATFGDLPLIEPVVKILSKKLFETSIPVEDKELSAELDTNIIVGSKLLDRPEVLKMAMEVLKENGYIISREPLDFVAGNRKVTNYTIFTIHITPSEILVLLKKNSKPRQLISLNVEDETNFSWIENLQDIIKTKKSDVLLYAQNKPLSGLLGLVNCIRKEPETQFVKGLLIFDKAEDFDQENVFYKEQLHKNMAINIWKNGTWGTYRHLLFPELNIVNSEHCFINSTVRGDLSSLRWIENSLTHDSVPPPEKVLVRVQYSALNFRDIMTAAGKINADVITLNRLQQECVQGFEFAGIDQDGSRVAGMITNGALSTIVLADKYTLLKVPDSMSLCDAATIVTVYGTIIYGMLLRGKLMRNESVLIHSGTGGIGQAAITMALHYGCQVFTTVGTQEKREFLLKTFPQLKDGNIGNSHDLSFEEMIKKCTNGRGVDMVLNSLAGDKLIASVHCLAHGGRFIEIGKFDLANNTDLNLKLIEKEASFHSVMLDNLMTAAPIVKWEITKMIANGLKTFIKPLPATVFSYDQVEEAFRYMSTGKHMGKVLIKIREDEEMSKTFTPKFPGIPRYFCDPDQSYIIIGGLGGFGLELADWLVLRGARDLVLSSRRGVSTGYQRMRIRIWESYGVKVHIATDDISTEDGCRNMLREANKLGTVHTIFNLAVVLADSVFENQTKDTFQISFGPKAIATTHLDHLSRELCPDLKNFVIFSSISCGRGNAGQTNYGMSNSVMERICEKRREEGYPALAVEWGAIGDVGILTNLQEEHVELEIGGTLQQKISSCLNVLNNFLRQTEATIISSMVVAEKKGGLQSCDNVVDTVIRILGLNDAKVVSHHASFPELGMDSMTGIEIKQTLEREFEILLTPKDMKTMTLAKLKKIQENKCFEGTDQAIQEKFTLMVDDLGDEEESKLTEKLLNKPSESKATLLLFPGIEGFAKKFEKLSVHLKAISIAFQYWDNHGFQTIQEIARILLPRVEKYVAQDQTFNIVGYSFGSLVALEIAHELESKGYLGKILIVDGGTSIMKKLAKQWVGDSEVEFETALITHLLSFYLPTERFSEYQAKFLKCSNWDERVNLAAEIAKQIIPNETDHQRNMANGFYNRIKAVELYTPSYEKLNSPIKLFKPSICFVKDIEEDYGFSKISNSSVEVQIFNGTHQSILDNDLLVQAINSAIEEPR